MPRDHAGSRAPFPEHPPQIIYESFRLFIGCKVAAGIMLRLEYDV